LRLTLKLGRIFTTEALLPPNAEHQLSDPFADDTRVWDYLLCGVLMLAVLLFFIWRMGWLNFLIN
jgi:hypothetical protein